MAIEGKKFEKLLKDIQ